MDFNHESQTHLNLLRGQGEIYCAYDKELMIIRNIIVLTNKNLRNTNVVTISINDILQNIMDHKDFLPSLLFDQEEPKLTKYKINLYFT